MLFSGEIRILNLRHYFALNQEMVLALLESSDEFLLIMDAVRQQDTCSSDFCICGIVDISAGGEDVVPLRAQRQGFFILAGLIEGVVHFYAVYNIPTGASRITLKIDAGATDEYDHATWANAGFIQ